MSAMAFRALVSPSSPFLIFLLIFSNFLLPMSCIFLAKCEFAGFFESCLLTFEEKIESV